MLKIKSVFLSIFFLSIFNNQGAAMIFHDGMPLNLEPRAMELDFSFANRTTHVFQVSKENPPKIVTGIVLGFGTGEQNLYDIPDVGEKIANNIGMRVLYKKGKTFPHYGLFDQANAEPDTVTFDNGVKPYIEDLTDPQKLVDNPDYVSFTISLYPVFRSANLSGPYDMVQVSKKGKISCVELGHGGIGHLKFFEIR